MSLNTLVIFAPKEFTLPTFTVLFDRYYTVEYSHIKKIPPSETCTSFDIERHNILNLSNCRVYRQNVNLVAYIIS